MLYILFTILSRRRADDISTALAADERSLLRLHIKMIISHLFDIIMHLSHYYALHATLKVDIITGHYG